MPTVFKTTGGYCYMADLRFAIKYSPTGCCQRFGGMYYLNRRGWDGSGMFLSNVCYHLKLLYKTSELKHLTNGMINLYPIISSNNSAFMYILIIISAWSHVCGWQRPTSHPRTHPLRNTYKTRHVLTGKPFHTYTSADDETLSQRGLCETCWCFSHLPENC